MLLLLMRHGIAEPLGEEYAEDFDRPLTGKGEKRVRQAAQGLLKLVPPIELLASSPKVRALETARIAGAVLEAPQVVEWEELMTGDHAGLLRKLRVCDAETVLLCGHEPHLSRFASRLLSGSPDKVAIEFKKSGVCAIELESATLLWHLGPAVLRLVGG
ncbi:phosphohistidine phosphatase SixA [bacterium]|nr:MAG: phosphohistidine phosphatase SixA [bacterium]